MSGTTVSTSDRRFIRSARLGGVVLFSANVASRGQLRAFDASIRRAAGARRIMVAVDQEGGIVRRLSFAAPVESARDAGRRGPRYVRSLMRRAGRDLATVGITADFAPVADIDLPGSFIGSRSYGTTSGAVARSVVAAVRGLADRGVAATAKHFPGLGGAAQNTDFTGSVRGRRPSRASLAPFRAAARAGAAMVMVGHAIHPGVSRGPASLARATYRLLRGPRVGFGGVAITDALSAAAITRYVSQPRAAVAAIRAGADMVIALGSRAEVRSVVGAIAAAVRSGRIPYGRYISAQRRVARLLAGM